MRTPLIGYKEIADEGNSEEKEETYSYLQEVKAPKLRRRL